MTAGMNTSDGPRCHACSHCAEPGDRYCKQCGSPLGAMPTPWQPASGHEQRDSSQDPVDATPGLGERTRYLCAAAHLDEEFCEKAIAELLVEPVRAIPPSPGVDSAAVLREVVAAQARRRIRDGLLLMLLIALALVEPYIAIFWIAVVAAVVALQNSSGGRYRRIAAGLVLALLVAFVISNLTIAIYCVVVVAVVVVALQNFGGGRYWRIVANVTQPVTVGTSRNWLNSALSLAFAGVILILLLPLAVLPLYLSYGLILIALGKLSASQMLHEIGSGGTMAYFNGCLMLVVLIVDEFTVAKLMNSSFRRDRFDPDASRVPSRWERLARSLGQNSFRTELNRVARSAENSPIAGQADVVVYRGNNPFVGAGERVHHHVISLPLEPSTGGSAADPVPISVNDVHRHVAQALGALRSSSSLSPGQRLEELQQREQVLIPADRLLINRFAQPSVLPDLSRPPLTHLPLDAARALAEDPLEWARYYNCFRVESWDRNLITSCYLHIGMDQRMLYLERTYCTLLPVSGRYQSIDHSADSPGATLSGRILFQLIAFPASVPQRLRSVFRRPAVLVQRSGEVVPDRYGTEKSLCEIAADTDVQAYFQEGSWNETIKSHNSASALVASPKAIPVIAPRLRADAERYINIFDRTLFRSVGQFLQQRGYSVVEFMKATESVSNNFIYAPVTNSAIGRGNTVVGNSTSMNYTRSDSAK